jgi:hypothetical protein
MIEASTAPPTFTPALLMATLAAFAAADAKFPAAALGFAVSPSYANYSAASTALRGSAKAAGLAASAACYKDTILKAVTPLTQVRCAATAIAAEGAATFACAAASAAVVAATIVRAFAANEER